MFHHIGRDLDNDMMKKIHKNCQDVVHECKGANELEIIYGQHGQNYYFIATSPLRHKANRGRKYQCIFSSNRWSIIYLYDSVIDWIFIILLLKDAGDMH